MPESGDFVLETSATNSKTLIRTTNKYKYRSFLFRIFYGGAFIFFRSAFVFSFRFGKVSFNFLIFSVRNLRAFSGIFVRFA